MLRLRHLLLCSIPLLPFATFAQNPSPAVAPVIATAKNSAARGAIEDVMKRFHDAVVAHKGDALSGLFLPEANIWLNVLTDQAYGQAHAKTPGIPKVRVSSYRDFAKFVSTTSHALDPEHSNVIIHTDGTIAAVYFDFAFRIDGKVENQGNETWQLVNTVDGWRISAISYSSQPSVPRP